MGPVPLWAEVAFAAVEDKTAAGTRSRGKRSIPSLSPHSGGGRAFPLWRDAEATIPNLTPGFLDKWSETLGATVSPTDWLEYLAGITGYPSFQEHFASLDDSILVVIDGVSPEAAREAAAELIPAAAMAGEECLVVSAQLDEPLDEGLVRPRVVHGVVAVGLLGGVHVLGLEDAFHGGILGVTIALILFINSHGGRLVRSLAVLIGLMIGGAFAFRNNEHTGIQILSDRFSGRWAQANTLFIQLLILGFLGCLMYGGWQEMSLLARFDTGALGISKAIPYGAIPISALLYALFSLVLVVRCFARERGA